MIGNFSRTALRCSSKLPIGSNSLLQSVSGGRNMRLLRCFARNNEEQLTGNRSGAPLKPGEEGGRILDGDTSAGFVAGKTNSAGKAISIDELKKYLEEKAKDEAVLFKKNKNYSFSRFDIFRPVLPLESIVGSRTFSKIQAGIWLGLAVASSWTGWYILGGVFCFIAAGPIVYLRRSHKILKNRVMLITLSDPSTWKKDQINLTLTTPFRKIETSLGKIKPVGEYVPILEKSRPDFERVNSPDFEPPTGEVAPGVPLFIEIDQDGKPVQKMLDLDYLLYRAENFDLLVDVLRGETAEVLKYSRVEKPIAREDELILGGRNIEKVAGSAVAPKAEADAATDPKTDRKQP